MIDQKAQELGRLLGQSDEYKELRGARNSQPRIWTGTGDGTSAAFSAASAAAAGPRSTAITR